MFAINALKPTLKVTATTVSCPVAGCQKKVRRQRQRFRRDDIFLCQDHHIYISPSTFEYAEESDNLLWTDADDLALLRKIKQPRIKRESRIARDNSEDAVTWNVFRCFERQRLLNAFVDLAWGSAIASSPSLIYWSYCQRSDVTWPSLSNASRLFGEEVSRRSEPDLIIDDPNVLLFVESKFSSGNTTKPSNPADLKQYVTGGNGFFSRVFNGGTTFKNVAVDDSLYELMRLWLIGAWIADQAGKPFCLVNIVREGAKTETTIESRFGKHITPDAQRRFVRLTWEELHRQIIKKHANADSVRLGQYLKGKSLGYAVSKKKGNEQGRLRKAFNFP